MQATFSTELDGYWSPKPTVDKVVNAQYIVRIATSCGPIAFKPNLFENAGIEAVYHPCPLAMSQKMNQIRPV